MPEKIRVRFIRLKVIDDSDWFGDGEFYFIASVDGQQVGDPSTIFPAVEGQYIDLPELPWSAIVNVDGKAEVVVKFQGKEKDLIWDDTLGDGLEHHVKPPWSQDVRHYVTDYFDLEWQVEVMMDGSFGLHLASDVYACRQAAGGVLEGTTINGQPLRARIEIHDVRPTPDPTGAPARPPFPATAAPPSKNQGNANVSSGSPINVVPNPPVIPILSGGAITADNAARIEVTYYQPNTLKFTDTDDRLEWSAVPLAGGAISFLPFNGGTAGVGPTVLVYGTAAGEVRLEARLRGAVAATYRALVLPVKPIVCRFNICNGHSASATPAITPADILNIMAIANRWFRQLGLTLVLDTNPAVSDGAVADPTNPGIFRIKVADAVTKNTPDTGFQKATLLNARPGVLNFAYIHSTHSPNTMGAADSYPASKSGATITDSGTPSSSRISPSGVEPESPAGTITMNLLTARARPGHPKLFSMYICDQIGTQPPTVPPTRVQQRIAEAANTVAHEVGHILNLGHRVEGADNTQPNGLVANGIFWDGLTHPPRQNVMHFNAPATQAQDFDILQARAVRQSPLVP